VTGEDVAKYIQSQLGDYRGLVNLRDTVDLLKMHVIMMHKSHNALLSRRSHDGMQGKSSLDA
jgi:hypothetical protein